jgi:hypothetical protein
VVGTRRLVPILTLALALVGCGSAATHASSTAGAGAPPTPAAPPSATGQPVSDSTSATPKPVDELSAAERPLRRQFPAVDGRSLRQVASAAHRTVQLTAATGFYAPGLNRYAFGLSDASNAFVYAPSAVYIARSPGAAAVGPFLAPADPMAVASQYRSEQNDPDAVKAVYDAQLPLAQSGVYAVLVLTRTAHGLIASSSEIAVAPSLPIPGVGQRPPAVATDTLASVHGDVKLLTTRIPPDDMHAVSFDQVLGKRPIALLFSTPALCVSRVCGPVTDIMVELEHEFGGRIAFIHEEIYVGNDPGEGLRPQMKAFHLATEPWLFTVNAKGVIAARLSGAFGVDEARAALEAALR